jgi:hypothetical protein
MTPAYRLSILALTIMFTLVTVNIVNADQMNSETPNALIKKVASSDDLKSKSAFKPKLRLAPKKVAPPIEEKIPTTRKAHRMKFSKPSKKLPKGIVKRVGKDKIKARPGTTIKKGPKNTVVFRNISQGVIIKYSCKCQIGSGSCKQTSSGGSASCVVNSGSKCQSCGYSTTGSGLAPISGNAGMAR